MKTYSIFFLIFISQLLFSQNNMNSFLASYKILIDDTSMLNSKGKIAESDNEVYKMLSNEYLNTIVQCQDLIKFELIYNKSEMIYYRKDFVVPDYFNDMQKGIAESFKFSSFYYNFNTKYYVEYFKFFDKNYNLFIDFESINWEITTESKLINGFLCYKAIYNNNKYSIPLVVWFSPEIVFQVGPEKCQFLPGLVLEYQLKDFSIVCERIDFNPTVEDLKKIAQPTGVEITQQELDDMINKTKEAYRN